MANKLTALLALGMVAVQAHAGETTESMTEKDMVSYGMGMSMAKTLKRDEIQVDQKLLLQGLQDGFAGKSAVPEKTLRKVMNAFLTEARRAGIARQQAAALENEKKGALFLAEYKTRDGVVTMPSGLEYKVLKHGDGKMPTEADTVECHYRGTLLNGTEFDATEPGKPATLNVAQLIPGWKEALQLMPAGSRWQIAVPPALAYGTRGAGADIGPNETLLFDIELVAVK